MLNELRRSRVENLQAAAQAALEMKKKQAHVYVAPKSSGGDGNNNNNDDDDEDSAPRVFRPSSSDIAHVRHLLNSEFLEAVLERYPLLYPHAAQVLAYSNDEEYADNQRQYEQKRSQISGLTTNYNSTVTSRTVPPLEAASLLRKFASWCSYGFTSTVQKLTTSNKNASQTRAELAEM